VFIVAYRSELLGELLREMELWVRKKMTDLFV